jgi:hypothetical protein
LAGNEIRHNEYSKIGKDVWRRLVLIGATVWRKCSSRNKMFPEPTRPRREKIICDQTLEE